MVNVFNINKEMYFNFQVKKNLHWNEDWEYWFYTLDESTWMEVFIINEVM